VIQSRIGQVHQYVDVAGRRVRSARRGPEQQGEANVLFRPQRSPQGRKQAPRPAHVLPLRERQVKRPRAWATSAEGAVVHGSAQRPLVNAHLLSQET
jgi:hypothetical protein